MSLPISLSINNTFVDFLVNASSSLGPQGHGFFRNYEPQILAISIAGPYVVNAFNFFNDLRIKPKIAPSFKDNIISFLDSNKFNIITSLFVGTLYLIFKDTNPTAIYVGYTAIALTHLYGIGQDLVAKDPLNLTKHLFTTVVSVFTIQSMQQGTYPVRWHHMSYGLIAMLPNLHALNSFGAWLAIDSAGYITNPKRDNYDFSNIFTNNLGLYVSQLVILTVYEIGRKILFA